MQEPYKEIYDNIDNMYYAIEQQNESQQYTNALFYLESEMFWKYSTLGKLSNMMFRLTIGDMTCEDVKKLTTNRVDYIPLENTELMQHLDNMATVDHWLNKQRNIGNRDMILFVDNAERL